jgi:hypothetical protein
MAYFIFKLVRIYNGPKVNDFLPVKRPLTTFAIITIILLALTIGFAITCVMNFNQGLKPYIQPRKVEDDEEKTYATEMQPNIHTAPVPSRMTID